MKINTTALATLCALAPLAQGVTLSGLWTFDNAANLGEATVGSDLVFAGSAPSHSASLADDGSNSLSGVITTVGGAANTMLSTHGIAPNGGSATLVRQYTIVTDIFSPAGSRGSWRTLFQTNPGNFGDAEYFIAPNDNVGVGDLGYSGSPMDETVWTRLVISIDMTSTGSETSLYLDGVLHHSHVYSGGEATPEDGRFTLDPSVYFFTDNDGDNASLNVGTLAIYDGAMTSAEAGALGVAGTAIVPEPSSLSLLALCGLAALRRRSR